MALAIFDLDNTLIAGDSDYLWGKFLVEIGIVDALIYEHENQRFYQEYRDGILDIQEFLNFALRPLNQHEPALLYAWREQFLINYIDPILLPASYTLLEQHRKRDDTLLIITATNAFVTAPIAQRLGVNHLMATQPEQIDGHYTGRAIGTPCFQSGKINCLEQWQQVHNESMQGSFFYTDSHNDLPLLKLVDNPIAIDPDAMLQQWALEHNWPIMSLRNGNEPFIVNRISNETAKLAIRR